ncbi:MAG: hypothetical protein V7K47_15090 [Nostoc sp.]
MSKGAKIRLKPKKNKIINMLISRSIRSRIFALMRKKTKAIAKAINDNTNITAIICNYWWLSLVVETASVFQGTITENWDEYSQVSSI